MGDAGAGYSWGAGVNRRGFLGAILAASVAPAIVRADSLMRIIPQEITLFIPGSAPLLLVPETSFVTYALAGIHSPRGIAIGQMIRGMVKDGLPRRAHDVQFFEDHLYDHREDVTFLRCRATFNREVPQYKDEPDGWGPQ